MRRPPLPLRLRLTLWNGAVMLVAVSVFGALIYTFVRLQILRHHDPSLRRTAAAVGRVIAQHEDCAHLTPEQVAQLDSIGRLVLLHDMEGKGELFYRSPDTAAFPIPFDIQADPAFLQRPAWFETHRGEAGLIRVLSQPYRSHAGRPGLIRVMDPLGDVEEPLRGLRTALLLLAPLALLVASVGGYWLAGRALAPVERVTRMAREIEAGELHRRLPEPVVRDEIGRLVDTLNEMIGRLEASFEGMKRFTADASHELRTPLATLRGTVDVALSRGRHASEYRDALASVGEEVDRLRAIVADLLVLARADAGRMDLQRNRLPLGEVVVQACEALRPVAHDRGLALSVDVHRVEVLGDERWLRQLLVNIVGNAIQFTSGPGAASRTIEVAVRAEDGNAVVTVADGGPGIPEDELPRVFDRFYRADPARSGAAEGAGLGLAIARWIVEAHGGSISAANRPVGGTAITIRLPASRQEG